MSNRGGLVPSAVGPWTSDTTGTPLALLGHKDGDDTFDFMQQYEQQLFADVPDCSGSNRRGVGRQSEVIACVSAKVPRCSSVC